MEYVPGKWWTKVDQCEIRAIIYDAKGVPQYKLGGHWNNQIWSEKLLDSIDSCLCIPPAKKTIFNNTLSRNTQRGIQESFYITRDIKEFKGSYIRIFFFTLFVMACLRSRLSHIKIV
jgi:hypothetical protein